MVFCYCSRGYAGAAKIAGIEGVQLNIAEALGQRGYLAVALGGYIGLIVALCPALKVALGLGVTEEIYFGHSYLTID